jgi:hypothetical protein
MDAQRPLLEQILQEHPVADVPLGRVAATVSPGGSLSLKDVVDDLNRISRNGGLKKPFILGYEDRDLATIEFNPQIWARQTKQTDPVTILAFQKELAALFEQTGRAECSVKIDGCEIARLHHSRVVGRYVWESTGKEPPSVAKLGQAVLLIALVFVLLLILYPIIAAAIQGPPPR